MSAKNELLKMIDERYHKFSKGQKKLADFIREDYDKAAFLTAAKIALGYSNLKVELYKGVIATIRVHLSEK